MRLARIMSGRSRYPQVPQEQLFADCWNFPSRPDMLPETSSRGHRFSDAASSLKSAAPLGARGIEKGASIENRVPTTRMPMSCKPQSAWPDVTGSPGYRCPTIGTGFPLWRIPLSRFSTATLSMATPSKARFSIASLAAFLFRLFLVTLGLFSLPATGVQNPHGVHLVQVKADATKKPEPPAPVVAPPGSNLYVAQRGDSLPSVARKYLKRTKYLTSLELAAAIREANHNRQGVFLKSGEQIIIPGILESAIVEKSVPVARDFEVRAIYLTGVMAGSDHGMRIIRHWREVGGNAVVFDIKDSDGIVNIAFDHPLATGQRHYISDLPKLIHFLHSENMHAIARIAIFRDEHLVTSHPELAVKSHRTGENWRENGKLVWTDPSNPKVQDYD